VTIEPIDFSPAKVLAEVATLMRVRALAKGLSFELEYETPIPSLVRSDPTRMRQIVLNLVSNGIKFTERGDVRVLARCEEKARTMKVSWAYAFATPASGWTPLRCSGSSDRFPKPTPL
jgi:signal transduction histidine kinase